MAPSKKTHGELATKTLAMPADTNPQGDIFGGWVLSQMDIAGGVVGRSITKGRVVTVFVDGMTFHKPVFVGDVLSCFAKLVKIGNTSMTLKIEAWVERDFKSFKVTEGTFVYVAVDENRVPRKIKKN
jgi:acyl-CoA thioesterase YciA